MKPFRPFQSSVAALALAVLFAPSGLLAQSPFATESLPAARLTPPPADAPSADLRPSQALPEPTPSSPAALQLQPDPATVRQRAYPSGALGALPSFDDAQNDARKPMPEPMLDLPVEPNFAELKMHRRGNPILVPDGPNPTEDAAVELSERVRFRDVKVFALKDLEVQAALADAKRARTDRELRAAMRRHYSLLFAKMRAADHSLATLIALREKETVKSLEEKLSR
jgi:hypothetical protein